MEKAFEKLDSIVSIIKGINSYEEFGYYREFIIKEIQSTINVIKGDNYVITMGSESNIDNTYDTYIKQAKDVMKEHQNEVIKMNNKLYNIDYDAIIKNPDVVIPNKGVIKKKAAKVANIVTYLNTNEEIYEMLVKIFGDGLIDELLKANVKDEYINKVENAINRLKDLEKNDYENNQTIKKRNKSYADELLKKNNLPYRAVSASTTLTKKSKPKINFNKTQSYYSFVHNRDNSSYKYVY